ncbi:MAG: BACON domain-containing protein [Bacteroidales bacterium]|nr:BACON domain-containing protein [Bacteroidales bacterium]
MRPFRYSRILALALCVTTAFVACDDIFGPDDPYNPNTPSTPSGNKYTLTVSPKGTVSFPADGGMVHFSVSTTADKFGASFPKRDWLKLAFSEDGNGIDATVTANDTGESREFQITIWGRKSGSDENVVEEVVSCIQPAMQTGSLWMTATPSTLEFPSDGGTLTSLILIDESMTYIQSHQPEEIVGWTEVKWENAQEGVWGKVIVITASKNSTGQERSGVIKLFSGLTKDDAINAMNGKLDPTRAVAKEIHLRQAASGGQGSVPSGALGGSFTIDSQGHKVAFSKGNLQYQASTKTWRFAEHQWDFVGFKYYIETGDDHFEWIYTGTVSGSTNEYVSSSNSGWIDVFGWGTSGYNGRYPYMTSLNPANYSIGNGKSIAGTNYDWGVFNAIGNGGNKAGLWRTLTRNEWEYVLVGRNTDYHCAPATVNGVHGLILLPDNWTPSTYHLENIDVAEWYNWSVNVISQSNWTNKLEPAGAVFLPCAGTRGDINYPDEPANGMGTGPEGYLPFSGTYWSSTLANDESACCLQFSFGSGNPEVTTTYLCLGESVRLVADR